MPWQTREIESLFNNKDKNTHRFKVVYKGDCSCGVDYTGETVRNLVVRVAEHSNPAPAHLWTCQTPAGAKLWAIQLIFNCSASDTIWDKWFFCQPFKCEYLREPWKIKRCLMKNTLLAFSSSIAFFPKLPNSLLTKVYNAVSITKERWLFYNHGQKWLRQTSITHLSRMSWLTSG